MRIHTLSGRAFRLLLFSFLFAFLLLLFSGGELEAQGVGGNGPRRPSPPPRALPKTPGVRGSSGSNPTALPKPTTTKDLDEARKRIREKRERAAAPEGKKADPPAVRPLPAAKGNLAARVSFERMGKGDVRVLSTTFRTVAAKGGHPFTLVSVKVANFSDGFISVEDLLLDGRNVSPLDDRDPRRLPAFPLLLKRFDEPGLLASPIPPRSKRTLTFVLPCALKSTSILRARVGHALKFRCAGFIDFSPLKILDAATSGTVTAGRRHEGILVIVENTSPSPLAAKLKISVETGSPPGAAFFFLAPVKLRGKEKRTLLFRTIPDEGVPGGEILPAHLKIRTVEVADLAL